MRALYRPHDGEEWIEVEVVGLHRLGGTIVQEVGRALPGRMLVNGADLREEHDGDCARSPRTAHSSVTQGAR